MADKYNLGTVGGIAVTELWSGIEGGLGTISKSGSITLNDDITNYKFLVFDLKIAHGTTNSRYITKLISVEQIKNLINDNISSVDISFVWGYSSNTDFFDIRCGTTTKILQYTANNSQCIRIVGIN